MIHQNSNFNRDVPRQRCLNEQVEIPDRVCRNLPTKECRAVPTEVCRDVVVGEDCAAHGALSLALAPKCSLEQREVCRNVPTQVYKYHEHNNISSRQNSLRISLFIFSSYLHDIKRDSFFNGHCRAKYLSFPVVQPDPDSGLQTGARRRPRGEGMPAHRNGGVPRCSP